jgi:hypothetical protein
MIDWFREQYARTDSNDGTPLTPLSLLNYFRRIKQDEIALEIKKEKVADTKY